MHCVSFRRRISACHLLHYQCEAALGGVEGGSRSSKSLSVDASLLIPPLSYFASWTHADCVLRSWHFWREEYDGAQSLIARQDFTFAVLQLIYGKDCIDCDIRAELLRHGMLMRAVKVQVS